MQLLIAAGLLIVLAIAAGCAPQSAESQDTTADEVTAQNESSSDFSPNPAVPSTPIPLVEILVEADSSEFEISFYSMGMLENGTMLMSFSSEQDIPDGQYLARISTQAGDSLEYLCRRHPDIPQTILCMGEPLAQGQIVSIQIETTSSLENAYDFSQAQLVADQVSAGTEVETIWQAWDMVSQCAQLSASGEFTPAGCEAFSSFTPKQSECVGPADCTQQCGKELGLEDQKAGISPQDVWDALGSEGKTTTAACQDFVTLQKFPWNLPTSLSQGVSSLFLARLSNSYEDPFFFKNPLYPAQPFLAYEDPFFIENPAESYEDPFFFGAPDQDYEDPFFITESEIGLNELILTTGDPTLYPVTDGGLFLFQGLKEVLYGVVTGSNPMSQALFDSFLPDPASSSFDPSLGGTGAGGPGSPQDGGASGEGSGEPTPLDDVSVVISDEAWETFDACVALIYRPWADGWDTFGEGTDYYYSRLISKYRSELDGVFVSHPDCATPEMLLILKSYESQFWEEVPPGFQQCATDMGHTLYDFMAFGGYWGEDQAVPMYDRRYAAFCSQLNAYAVGAPEKVPDSCMTDEFISNFVGAGYCDNAQEIPYVVYQCLEALGEDGSDMHGAPPMYTDNLNNVGAPHIGGSVALNDPGSLEEAYYLKYLDYWNDPDAYGDGSSWPAPCTSTEFIEWMEQAEQNRYGIDPTTDSPYENCETCSVVYDCATSPNLFYCAEPSEEDDLFIQTADQCALDISWPGSLETPQHTANLVAYLAAAAPWMREDTMPDACETTVTAAASFSPGLYPGFLQSVLGIWGTNGTSIWGRSSTTSSAWSAPLEFQVPYLVQEQKAPGSGSGGSDTTCAPQTCTWGYEWDTSSCSCKRP